MTISQFCLITPSNPCCTSRIPHCSPFHTGMDARDLHFFLHFCQVCLQFAQTKPTPLGLTLFVSVSCLHCYGQWNLNFIFCLLMTRAEKCSCLWHYSLDLGVFSSVRFVRFFVCEIICLQKEVVLRFSFQLLRWDSLVDTTPSGKNGHPCRIPVLEEGACSLFSRK